MPQLHNHQTSRALLSPASPPSYSVLNSSTPGPDQLKQTECPNVGISNDLSKPPDRCPCSFIGLIRSAPFCLSRSLRAHHPLFSSTTYLRLYHFGMDSLSFSLINCIKFVGFLAFFCTLILISYSPSGLASESQDPWSSSRPHGLIYSADEQGPAQATATSASCLTSASGRTACTAGLSDVDSRILDAAPILGYYEDSNGSLADWMANIGDAVPLTQLNIPGTHDSATWNYTQETQVELMPITGALPPAIAFQCQSRSLFQMLGDGIRFFDLRVGFLPGHYELGFFHAAALLSSTTTLDNVLLGLYRWLDDHPSETVFISIKVDNGTFDDPPSKKQPSSAEFQTKMYDLLTRDEVARSHWFLRDSELGNLGQVRKKLILLQRFEWDLIRSNPSFQPLGIPLPPSKFHDNDPAFSIIYNDQTKASAFIEDFFNLIPNPTPFQDKVDRKIEAIQNNLVQAATNPETLDQLYITFVSGGALLNVPPVTPKMLALGYQGDDGVNSRLLQILQTISQRKRTGIVLLDWYHHTSGIIEGIIDYNFHLD